MQIKPKYLPIASGSTLGALKVGGGLSVSLDGTVESESQQPFTGLETPAHFSVSYDQVTRIFTVTVSSDTVVVVSGEPITLPAGIYTTIAHANTSGVYWCFINGSGIPECDVSLAFDSEAPLAYAYYNATTVGSVLFDERHPNTWPADLHGYHHFLDGSRLLSGGTISSYTLGSSTTADMQYDIDSVSFADESIEHTLDALTGGNGVYTYWYRSGSDAAGEWSWVTGANLPFPVSGTEMQYNLLSAGNWTLANITADNLWMVVWVVATNAYAPGFDSPHRYVNIVGQTLYTSLATAQSASFLTSISWGELPFAEICPLAKIIVRYTNTAGNDFNYVSVESIRGTKASITSTVSPTNHNSLSGRSVEGAHPALALIYDNTASGLTAETVQAAIDEVVTYGYKYVYTAQSMESPLVADWALATNAALSNDATNAGITVRLFGDASEAGAGTQLVMVPGTATSITITARWRAVTSPGAAKGVAFKLYHRLEGTTVGAWGNYLLTTATTSDDTWQMFTQTILLSTLGITAGDYRQFEITRLPTDAGDDLVGNVALEMIVLEFV